MKKSVVVLSLLAVASGLAVLVGFSQGKCYLIMGGIFSMIMFGVTALEVAKGSSRKK